MTREARHDHKGYFYHIFVRGQRKNPLFFSNDDMGAFVNILKQVLDETDIELHAYCLMRNHFHLLVYRKNTSLAQFMNKLLTRYALYFNNKYDLTGHVYQGRFGSKPIPNEEFNLPRVINYMHYNPVDAGIVSKEGDYPFSSAGFYEGKKSYIEQLKKIDYDRSITDREFETYKDCIGTKEEYEKLLKRKPGREKSRYKERRRKSLTESMKILLDEQGLTRMVFFKRRSPEEKQKVKQIIKALLQEGYKQADIARELKLGNSTIHKMLNFEKLS